MKKLLSIVLLILSLLPWTSCSFILPEPHSLKFDKETFEPLANDIIRQREIFEMDDFTRHYKSLNNVLIRFDKEPIDSFDNSQPFNFVVDSLKLNPNTIEDFRKRLETTKLREFYKSNDSIVFIVDGFLDHSWGFFYSRKPLGSDTLGFRFGKYYVDYVEDVNSNWKKASIN